MYIRVSDASFEYDVYSLVKAFYPDEEIRLCREDAEPLGSSVDSASLIWLDVLICEDTVRVTINGEERPAVAETVVGLPRKEVKNALKRLLYKELAAVTGRTLYWGTLTGVRPTKIAFGMLDGDNTENAQSSIDDNRTERITAYMRDTYLTSDEKIALSIDIANRERHILKSVESPDGYSLYIGIPFCPSICLYCSFSSSAISEWRERTDAYLEALSREIVACGAMFSDRTLTTVYIGGGTPTALSAAQLDGLLSIVEGNFNLSAICEYTVEAGRPDSIDAEKLAILVSHGVDRISVNPQTMNDATLRRIGRAHTSADIKRAYDLVRRYDFKSVNMDIIIGLPGEGEAEVRHTADEIKKLAPDALTVHSLAIKRSSRLNLELEKYRHELNRCSQAVMNITNEAALSMGMLPYYLYRQKNIAGNLENTGYAIPGHEGLYNILIMEERQDILALGAGADSKKVGRGESTVAGELVDVIAHAKCAAYDYTKKVSRCENVKDIDSYINRVDEMIGRKRELFGI